MQATNTINRFSIRKLSFLVILDNFYIQGYFILPKFTYLTKIRLYTELAGINI